MTGHDGTGPDGTGHDGTGHDRTEHDGTWQDGTWQDGTAQAAGRDAVLELVGVRKTYPGSAPVRALAGVDLRIGAGERVAVLGPSGSGKSTLLHILGTLERPTSGVIRVAGRDVSDLSDAEVSAVRGHQLGFVFQQFFLLDHLDAVGNVALGLLYRGGSVPERRLAAAGALARVGVGDRLARRPHPLGHQAAWLGDGRGRDAADDMTAIMPRSRLRAGDTLRSSAGSLRSRAWRAALSALGIAIGIAAAVAVLGVSASSRAALLAELGAEGNLLTVSAGQDFTGSPPRPPPPAPR